MCKQSEKTSFEVLRLRSGPKILNLTGSTNEYIDFENSYQKSFRLGIYGTQHISRPSVDLS
jgi:hypothetical protein